MITNKSGAAPPEPSRGGDSQTQYKQHLSRLVRAMETPSEITPTSLGKAIIAVAFGEREGARNYYGIRVANAAPFLSSLLRSEYAKGQLLEAHRGLLESADPSIRHASSLLQQLKADQHPVVANRMATTFEVNQRLVLETRSGLIVAFGGSKFDTEWATMLDDQSLNPTVDQLPEAFTGYEPLASEH